MNIEEFVNDLKPGERVVILTDYPETRRHIWQRIGDHLHERGELNMACCTQSSSLGRDFGDSYAFIRICVLADDSIQLLAGRYDRMIWDDENIDKHDRGRRGVAHWASAEWSVLQRNGDRRG